MKKNKPKLALSTRQKNLAKKIRATPKLKIKSGDMVKVISGGDKGKTGKVLNVNALDQRILVEGVNLRKKHVKPSQKYPQGGVISKESPIAYSNVQILDDKGNPTRIGVKTEKKGGKIVRLRTARTTGAAISAPVKAAPTKVAKTPAAEK